MRGCRLFAVGVMAMAVVLCFGTWPGWANPGDEKWDYSALGTIPGVLLIEAGVEPRTSIVMDSKGNCIIASTNMLGRTNYTTLIVKIAPDGHMVWQRSDDDMPWLSAGIVLDSKDNVIAAGLNRESSNMLWHIVSYDPYGNKNWSKDISSIGSKRVSTLNDISIDSKDNIILGGSCIDSGQKLGYIISLKSFDGSDNWDVSFATNSSSVVKVITDSKDNVVAAAFVQVSSLSYWEIASFSSSGVSIWNRSSNYCLPADMAVDGSDNVIVVGNKRNGANADWYVVSYSPAGDVNWSDTRNGVTNDHDLAYSVATDSNDNVIVTGLEDSKMYTVSYNPSGGEQWVREIPDGIAVNVATDYKDRVIVAGGVYDAANASTWRVVSYSDKGDKLWESNYSDPGSALATNIAISPVTGDVAVIGTAKNATNVLVIDYEGYPLPTTGHVLIPSEVRTVQPAAETPNGNPVNGTYLGFGDVVANGTHFKVEAAFPAYLKQSDNSTLAVKIFIAAQMPDDYSRLAYFDSSNNMKFQPPDKLSSWKSSVSGEVAKTTIYPEVDVTSALSNIPSGTHYWYTLVVPDTVPYDFAGVDWSTTPWEITVNIFDVQ